MAGLTAVARRHRSLPGLAEAHDFVTELPDGYDTGVGESTVRHSDRIHVLEEGRIVESRSHEQLVAQPGLYPALWRIQTGDAHALRPTA